jgi:hypothetical protein
MMEDELARKRQETRYKMTSEVHRDIYVPSAHVITDYYE